MKQVHLKMSTLKTVCNKDLTKVKTTDEIDKVTCPTCDSGIKKLFASGGN